MTRPSRDASVIGFKHARDRNTLGRARICLGPELVPNASQRRLLRQTFYKVV